MLMDFVFRFLKMMEFIAASERLNLFERILIESYKDLDLRILLYSVFIMRLRRPISSIKPSEYNLANLESLTRFFISSDN